MSRLPPVSQHFLPKLPDRKWQGVMRTTSFPGKQWRQWLLETKRFLKVEGISWNYCARGEPLGESSRAQPPRRPLLWRLSPLSQQISFRLLSSSESFPYCPATSVRLILHLWLESYLCLRLARGQSQVDSSDRRQNTECTLSLPDHQSSRLWRIP